MHLLLDPYFWLRHPPCRFPDPRFQSPAAHCTIITAPIPSEAPCLPNFARLFHLLEVVKSMMNGYRKMRVSDRFISKSSSVDFSDLTFYPEPKESHEHPYPTSMAQEKDTDVEIHDRYLTWQEVEAAQPGTGLALSRSCSSASRRFRASGKTILETMVRKAFTMRRSSSVAGGYWRIHDTDGGDGEGEFVEEQQLRSPMKKKKKKGKILRACKQIFGF